MEDILSILTSHGRESDFLVFPPFLLQGLSVVPPVLRTIPVVQSVLFSLRLDGKVGVVAHHGVHVLVGLVILQQHAVLLGGGRALLVVDGVRTGLPHVVPGGRAEITTMTFIRRNQGGNF